MARLGCISLRVSWPNPLVLSHLETELPMFESAEIGHAIDKDTYDAEVPAPA